MSTETYEATTTEEWQAGREAMDEYEERLRTAPTSCQLFEEMLSSFDNDVRVQRYDIMLLLMSSLNGIHTSHDDPSRHAHGLQLDI